MAKHLFFKMSVINTSSCRPIWQSSTNKLLSKSQMIYNNIPRTISRGVAGQCPRPSGILVAT